MKSHFEIITSPWQLDKHGLCETASEPKNSVPPAPFTDPFVISSIKGEEGIDVSE